MWLRRRAQPPSTDAEALRAEITLLTEENRRGPRLEVEKRLVRIRHLLGSELLGQNGAAPAFARPDPSGLPAQALPRLERGALTPELLRAAILRDGCALVRELIPRESALRLAREIDRAYQVRQAPDGDPRYYEEFQPEDRFGPVLWRAWIMEGGGLLAADSPALCFEMAEAFEEAGVPALVRGYLGEPGLLSVHKTTLRRAEPSVGGQWHQDGAFMGPVRALNLWLSLSRCGDESPGLDILPRRLERFLATGTEGAALSWTISGEEVRSAAPDVAVVRPVFEPGDALLFDELFLHRTGSEPSMERPRFAIESWFFGASAFPADYAPLAV